MGTLLTLPSLPEIGLSEARYAHDCRKADRHRDPHGHEAAKVGLYVTMADSPYLDWEHKLRLFKYALDKHCNPPDICDNDCWQFYRDLGDLVREHCGREALKLALLEDEQYAHRLEMGQLREKIVSEAQWFFRQLMGSQRDCPLWFSAEDWDQLCLIRNQWK